MYGLTIDQWQSLVGYLSKEIQDELSTKMLKMQQRQAGPKSLGYVTLLPEC